MFSGLLYAMEKELFISVLIAFIFFVFRVLEMKYIDKEWTPLKFVVRDIFMIFVASLVGSSLYFYAQTDILDFFSVVTDNVDAAPIASQIFTDEPGF